MAIYFPNITPEIFHIGPLSIRWYSLSYIIGILIGWWGFKKLHKEQIEKEILDKMLSYIILGIIIGGRLGYVIFYDLYHSLLDPISIIKIWQGGMSFHGGALGLTIALSIFCKKYNISTISTLDIASCFAPIGICLGRIANFINGELWGRITDVPWAIIFPLADSYPRHPSQLYEAIFEGLMLFAIMMFTLFKTTAKNHPGLMLGIMLIWYSCVRIIIEFFREPDMQIGYLILGTTLGQILSIPTLIAGIVLIIYSQRNQIT